MVGILDFFAGGGGGQKFPQQAPAPIVDSVPEIVDQQPDPEDGLIQSLEQYFAGAGGGREARNPDGLLGMIPEKGPPVPEGLQIRSDEGSKRGASGSHISYLDSKKELTGGIGHLLTPAEKKLYPKGTDIPKQQVEDWYNQDLVEANADAEAYLNSLGPQPDEVRKILLNMSFNMGRKRFNPSSWPGLTAALKAGDYKEAGAEMKRSDWWGQVGDRSKRLKKRMEALAK